MIGPEADPVVFRRIAQRVQDILNAAKEREENGESLAVDIDARFRLQDLGAVQFQLASAILEETGGLRQEEVVGELLSLGLAAVLDSAAKVARIGDPEPECELEEPDASRVDAAVSRLLAGAPIRRGSRVLN